MPATVHILPDGKRLHLNHGPIDLIIEAEGAANQVQRAYAAAEDRFETVLQEIVSELSILCEEITSTGNEVQGEIARTMTRAVQPHWKRRVTPMAAVAGSVAEHILNAMTETADLKRAYVNNGGDIAIHLVGNEVFEIASPSGKISIAAEDRVRGIATSGWRGRSFSLGIADAVTVLAPTASVADVVATLIANAVDLPFSPKIRRQPANEIAPDSDLKDRLVTVGVETLTNEEILEALGNGVIGMEALLFEQPFDAVSLMLDTEVISLKCTNGIAEQDDDKFESAQAGHWN